MFQKYSGAWKELFPGAAVFDFSSILVEKRKKMKGKSGLSGDSKASLDCLYFIILLCGNHENGMNCFLIFFGEIMESA